MACVLVEMVSGAQPWASMQIQQIMMAVGVRKRAPDVPDEAPAAAMLPGEQGVGVVEPVEQLEPAGHGVHCARSDRSVAFE